MIRYTSDGATVAQVLEEFGFALDDDGIHWCYRGARGERRLAAGMLEGLLREAGSSRLRAYVKQEKDLWEK